MSADRVSVVTGGSRGIGAAVVARLLAAGARVAVLSSSGAAPDGALGLAADLRDGAAVAAAVERVRAELGAPTELVHSAGVTGDGLALTTSDAALGEVLDINVVGAHRVVRPVLRGMVRARHGRIVLVGSAVGLLGNPGQTAYAASKAALVGYARSLVREVGARGITVNVVAPGPVETDMLRALTDDQRARVVGQVPLGRVASADEVAAVVEFLLSPEAGYVTGAVVPVDGGLGMGH